MSDSIEELAAKLEAWAREDSKRAEPELGLSEHVTLRAAALKLRECREALRGAVGALEFSRDYHKDLGNEDQAFAQDRLDAARKALGAK